MFPSGKTEPGSRPQTTWTTLRACHSRSPCGTASSVEVCSSPPIPALSAGCEAIFRYCLIRRIARHQAGRDWKSSQKELKKSASAVRVNAKPQLNPGSRQKPQHYSGGDTNRQGNRKHPFPSGHGAPQLDRQDLARIPCRFRIYGKYHSILHSI
jgi:hypothetical protein